MSFLFTQNGIYWLLLKWRILHFVVWIAGLVGEKGNEIAKQIISQFSLFFSSVVADHAIKTEHNGWSRLRERAHGLLFLHTNPTPIPHTPTEEICFNGSFERLFLLLLINKTNVLVAASCLCESHTRLSKQSPFPRNCFLGSTSYFFINDFVETKYFLKKVQTLKTYSFKWYWYPVIKWCSKLTHVMIDNPKLNFRLANCERKCRAQNKIHRVCRQDCPYYRVSNFDIRV